MASAEFRRRRKRNSCVSRDVTAAGRLEFQCKQRGICRPFVPDLATDIARITFDFRPQPAALAGQPAYSSPKSLGKYCRSRGQSSCALVLAGFMIF